MGDQVGRNLRTRGAESGSSRTSETGASSHVEEQLTSVDVVVASTSAPGLVLDAATVEQALRARRGRQLLLIDLAVPRDLDPAIHELDGCYLYDIDDLESIVADTLSAAGGRPSGRSRWSPARRTKFHEWHASLDVVPAIASLRARARGDPRGRAAQGGREAR